MFIRVVVNFCRFTEHQLYEYRIAVILMGDYNRDNKMQMELVKKFMGSERGPILIWIGLMPNLILQLWSGYDELVVDNLIHLVLWPILLLSSLPIHCQWRFQVSAPADGIWRVGVGPPWVQNRNYRLIRCFQGRPAVIQLLLPLQWFLRWSNIRVLRYSSGW